MVLNLHFQLKLLNCWVLYLSQTKEQREAKEPKTYFGNGSVVWTDNKVTVAPKKDAQPAPATEEAIDDLPF